MEAVHAAAQETIEDDLMAPELYPYGSRGQSRALPRQQVQRPLGRYLQLT